MARKCYLLLCDFCDTYTDLHNYDERQHRFEGEHSLLHNAYTYDSHFMSKFLIAHINHSIRLIPDMTDEYVKVITSGQYTRFLYEDIDKYVEELNQKHVERLRDRQFDRHIGQFQLNLLEKDVEEELKLIKGQDLEPDERNKMYVNLGKEWALQWMLHRIEDITKRGDHF